MTTQSMPFVAPLARWSARLALFSVGLLLVALALHRLGFVSTLLALNLFAAGCAGGALAVLMGLAAFSQIWLHGQGGGLTVAIGIALPMLAVSVPAGFFAATYNLPRINDVTTDLASPPRFVILASRSPGANPSTYPGPDVGNLQAKAYPDIRTLVVDRPVDETFEVIEEVARRMRWTVVTAEVRAGRPPAKSAILEATDQTLIVGFVDDIVVRVAGTNSRTRIDARSASRYGNFDFGQNAARLRKFLAEVAMRTDATSPTGIAKRRALRNARTRALLKKQKARDQQKAAPRTPRGRAQ
jgi:uncharacterized protein (DUF1499 family)